MRKNLPIILLSALVVIGLLVGVGYYFQTYRHGKAPEEGLTVVTAESTTASNKRTLLAENKEGDFQLYAQGDKAILVHQGKSKTFSGWSHYLTKERPKLYYTDLNGDKKKELVVRLVSGVDRSTGQELYTYDLYVLTPHKQKDGSFEYDLVVADRESWKRPFTQAVKCSVTQLKNDPMRVQVAMGNASGSLSFDEKTGISTSKYTAFSRAETNTDGTPQTIYGWDYGIGTYTVEDGTLHAVHWAYTETAETIYGTGDENARMAYLALAAAQKGTSLFNIRSVVKQIGSNSWKGDADYSAAWKNVDMRYDARIEGEYYYSEGFFLSTQDGQPITVTLTFDARLAE